MEVHFAVHKVKIEFLYKTYIDVNLQSLNIKGPKLNILIFFIFYLDAYFI
jgi:hypothetical protein